MVLPFPQRRSPALLSATALMAAAAATVSALAAAAVSGSTCRWGAGAAEPQPAGWSNATTCTPPSLVGPGSVSLDGGASGDYVDVQAFRYASPPLRSLGNVTVALVAHGADGCTACGGSPLCTKMTPAECLNKTLTDLARAGELGTDLAVLPENWPMQESEGGAETTPPAQPVDGPLIAAAAAVAKRYGMNVVAPIREARGGRLFNTAVVINRKGETVGTYSKVFPVWGSQDRTSGEILHVDPSEDGVRVFELDVGTIAIAICYDINFPELWHQAAALGADLFVWPSAMATPDPTTYGYARVYRTPIVAVGFPGDVVDSTGLQHDTTEVSPGLKVAHIDLGRVWVHWDYNIPKVQKLLKEHAGEVALAVPGPPFYLLQAVAPNVSVAALVQEYGIEIARDYIGRSRRGINAWRQLGRPEQE